jgi:hypothetical protein
MLNKSIIRGIGIIGLVALCLPAAALASGNPGDAGLLFLRLGMGTREAAMGGTGVASTEGAAAAYWNPSRLAFRPEGTELLLQQQQWLGTFDYTAAALTHHGSFGIIGLTFAGLFSEEIQRYGAEPAAIPEGTFSPYDLAFGASYSRGLGEEFAVGAQAKLVYEKIDIYSGTVFLFDLFATWHLSKLPGLTLAVSATNLGGQMTINQEPFDPPQTVTVGGAWEPVSGALANRLTVAGDVGFFNDGNNKAHLGAEFKLVPELALRLGYRVNYESQGLTAGAGFRYKVLGLGYAYEDITDDALDSGHRLSLEFWF